MSEIARLAGQGLFHHSAPVGTVDRPRDGSQVLLRQELRQICGDKQVRGQAKKLIYKSGTVPVLVTHQTQPDDCQAELRSGRD